jgi:3-deoxy-7-phosphoheptulonate synthase
MLLPSFEDLKQSLNLNAGFNYKGLSFSQKSFHLIAGLNAVDNPKNVAIVFAALQKEGLQLARMGAYKPRTSPYAFQGHGKDCLNYVFELAGLYEIRAIAMEITHEQHIDEISESLDKLNNPTGVFLQIGTRNAQNFELLKSVGQQKQFPVLVKRGYGISLAESLAALSYVLHEGNNRVLYCLRGLKTHYAEPHRNLSDFAQLPLIQKTTGLAVGIDPSHCIGYYKNDHMQLSEIHHATAQGVVAGANMVLLDVHPKPKESLVDAQQALPLEHFTHFVQDINLCRELYLKRSSRVKTYSTESAY